MLTDYASLKASIAQWLDRSDLTAQIPEFIQLAEREIARTVRRTTKRATVTLNAASYTLAADVAELRTIRLVTAIPGRDGSLIQRAASVLDDLRTRLLSTGYPKYFAHVGTQLLFVPAPQSAMQAEISYYEALVPLSDTNTTNSVLADAPDVYLFGALAYGEKYLQNDERSAMWDAAFQKQLDKLVIARDNAEWAQTPKQARLPVVYG